MFCVWTSLTCFLWVQTLCSVSLDRQQGWIKEFLKERGCLLLNLVFKGEGVPPSKCVIFIFLKQNFLTKVGVGGGGSDPRHSPLSYGSATGQVHNGNLTGFCIFSIWTLSCCLVFILEIHLVFLQITICMFNSVVAISSMEFIRLIAIFTCSPIALPQKVKHNQINVGAMSCI